MRRAAPESKLQNRPCRYETTKRSVGWPHIDLFSCSRFSWNFLGLSVADDASHRFDHVPQNLRILIVEPVVLAQPEVSKHFGSDCANNFEVVAVAARALVASWHPARLVFEVAFAGEDHGKAMLVGRGNHLVVAN